MSGWKDWQIGEVVTEGEFQSFIQDQVVQVYANASARDSALGANEATGMVAYLTETDEYQVYNSVGEWVAVGAGTISSVIAGTALTGGGNEGDVTLNVDLSAVTIPTSQISDITATAAELNVLDGATVTAAALNTIDDGTSGFTALSNGTAGISYQPISQNVIINGAFDIWQRGTSFTIAVNAFYADRWRCDFANANPTSATLTQESFTPNDLTAIGYGEGQFYLRQTVTTAGSATTINLSTQIEDVRTLANQVVTLSFYAKSDSARSHLIVGSQVFGSGGSSTINPLASTLSTTASWQRFSFTFTLPSVSGKTIGSGSSLRMRIRQAIADGSVLDTWGWQLEAGSVATPFKRHAPSLQGELAACQRYFQRIEADGFASSYAFGNIATTTSARVFLPLATTLRATPTMIVSGTQTITFNGTALTPSSYSNLLVQANGLKVHAAVTGAVGSHACSWNISSGVIDLSSEL